MVGKKWLKWSQLGPGNCVCVPAQARMCIVCSNAHVCEKESEREKEKEREGVLEVMQDVFPHMAFDIFL